MNGSAEVRRVIEFIQASKVASPKQKSLASLQATASFLFLFARAARDQGYQVVTAAIQGDTSPLLYFFRRQIQYFKVGELKSCLLIFAATRCKR